MSRRQRQRAREQRNKTFGRRMAMITAVCILGTLIYGLAQ